MLVTAVVLEGAEPPVQRVFESTSAAATVHTNIAYVTGGGARQQLDLYIPNRDRDGQPFTRPIPVILWLHWGSWTRGSKDEMCFPFGLGYTKKGYAIASINYRLTTTDPFPAQIEDCKSAVRWLRAHAQEYNLDPERIGVWGVSAGGHLAAMLGTTSDDRTFDVGESLDQSSAVLCVCDHFGPADLEALFSDPRIDAFLEKEGAAVHRFFGGNPVDKIELVRRASPVSHISRGDAPFLIVHGDSDPLVPVNQSRRLHAALEKAGVESELVIVVGGFHGPIGYLTPAMLTKYLAFFDKHLRPAAP